MAYNFDRLLSIGISWDDAQALRRISMTLHRWHELECGERNNHASWSLVRGRKEMRYGQHSSGKGPHYVFLDDFYAGAPFLEIHYNNDNRTAYEPIADRERGALKRLASIMAKYPTLSAYVQTDPRGASLYIGEGLTDTNYSNGIAVYK